MNVEEFKAITNNKCFLCGKDFVNHPDFQLYCNEHVIYEEINNSGFGDNIVKILISKRILLVFSFLTHKIELHLYNNDIVERFVKSFICKDITDWFLNREELLLKVNERISGLLILL
jgi:hypothetical protein